MSSIPISLCSGTAATSPSDPSKVVDPLLEAAADIAKRCIGLKQVGMQTDALILLQNAIKATKASVPEAISQIEVALLRDILRTEEPTPEGASPSIPKDPKTKIEDKIRKLIARGVNTTQLIFSGRDLGRYVFWKGTCWEINEKTIDEGGFKKVKLVRNIVTGEIALGKRSVLMNEMAKAVPMFFEIRHKAAVKERDMAIALQGIPNVIPTYCNTSYISKKRGQVYFSIEMLGSGGSLAKCDWKKFSPRETLSLLLDIFRGVKDMHARGFAHGDMSLGNTVYSKELMKAFLIDFGTSKPLDNISLSFDKNRLYFLLQDILNMTALPEPIQNQLKALKNKITNEDFSIVEAYQQLEAIAKEVATSD
ncbi:MAG TPA: hypothetical protein VLG44_05735 [Chlamydiales bacterium]|nr:hypothetical protein [Chlamydiales bacterium]